MTNYIEFRDAAWDEFNSLMHSFEWNEGDFVVIKEYLADFGPKVRVASDEVPLEEYIGTAYWLFMLLDLLGSHCEFLWEKQPKIEEAYEWLYLFCTGCGIETELESWRKYNAEHADDNPIQMDGFGMN